MSAERTFDIAVYGATGFTGRLVAEYLARNAGPEVRWALAGRNRHKLSRLQNELAAAYPTASEVALIEADSGDPTSLLAMAQKTRVVLTTVGPYVDGGDRVVRACIDGGADYVDITGEPEFVARVISEFDAEARERGVRIVNCCGFDSIPTDLGVLYTVLDLPAGSPVRIDGFVDANGTFSGGTWRSAITAMGRLRQTFWEQRKRARARKRAPRDASGRRVRTVSPKLRFEKSLQAWVYPLPTIDPQVVKRSARSLERYGPDFRYAHHAMARRLENVLALALGVGVVMALAQLGPVRKRLLDFKKSGDGPSPEKRASSWFKATFVGTAGGKRVVTCVSGGDPGYDETAKMVAESALCLAFDSLPERAGVLTTAEAMGTTLIERLHRAGLRFDIIEQT